MPVPRTLEELERELEQLKAQLPRHSVKPATLMRIEELEEEIEEMKRNQSLMQDK